MRWLISLLVASGCSTGSDRPPQATSAELGTRAAPIATTEEQQLLGQCDKGIDEACVQLQAVYLNAQRKDETSSLVKRLCEGGRRSFCPTYAFLLAEGDGVPRDRARARQLFDQTCKDDPTSCSEFGNLYTSGTGVAKDLELGCVLLRHACTHRDEQACRELAVCTR